MGFMDRMKGGLDAAKQAQEMAAAQGGGLANAGMPTAEDMADVQRVTKLNNQGVEKPALVKVLAPTGKTDPGGGRQFAITVDVEASQAAGGDGYEATFTQNLVEVQMPSLEVGSTIIVRVDPDDRNSMMFWSKPQ